MHTELYVTTRLLCDATPKLFRIPVSITSVAGELNIKASEVRRKGGKKKVCYCNFEVTFVLLLFHV